jgi:hypothetical protein
VVAVLPVPALVAFDFLVTDLFYVNRSPDYLRISESFEAGYLLFDFAFCCIYVALLLAVPLVAFSVVFEFVCKTTTRLWCGLFFGSIVSWLQCLDSLWTFDFSSFPIAIESSLFLLGPIVIFVCVSLSPRLFRPASES